MWTSTNKKFYLFLGLIFVIGIIGGLIFLSVVPEVSKTTMITSINNFFIDIKNVNINYILSHAVILSFILILSFLIIGLPIGLFYLFFNGFSIGFIISSFITVAGFKGSLFALIYILITKTVFLFFLTVFIITCIKISIKVIGYYINKKNTIIKEQIIILFKRCLVSLLIIFINDFLIYLIGDNLINIFNFLVI
ncbi:MAG: hypothetical protein RR189_02105 [Bacilli bacterium]